MYAQTESLFKGRTLGNIIAIELVFFFIKI